VRRPGGTFTALQKSAHWAILTPNCPQRGKALRLLRPRNIVDGGTLLFEAPTRDLLGAGDVVWPATLALARLLIHCPSFVAGLNVLELGAGLGLPSCAAAAAGATSVTVTDADAELVLFAHKSVAMNLAPEQTGCDIRAVRADWTHVPGDWPSRPIIDVVIASDVLYDGALAADVAGVIAHYLLASRPPGSVLPRALVADPKQRDHRAVFAAKCASLGLECQVTDLPGPEDCLLLCVTPAS
jgi:predicted nicotinamide N-methyase